MVNLSITMIALVFIKKNRLLPNDDGEVIDSINNKKSKQHKRYSQYFGYPFRMTLRQLNKDIQQWHGASFYHGEHSHELAPELSL